MIKINETYAIGSNPNNIVLMKSRINGNTGETEWSNIGCYPTYEGLYYGLIREKQISTSAITELKDVVDAISALHTEAVKAIVLHKCNK